MKRSVIRVAALAVAALSSVACNTEITGLEPPSDPTTETFAPTLGVDIASMEKTALGVFFEDIVVGTGAEVVALTDSVEISYALFLKDGSLVESGSDVVFNFDPEGLIQGFRDGLIGMKVGGERKLVVPSELGYGNRTQRDLQGNVTIPRQSTLIFDIELKEVFNPT